MERWNDGRAIASSAKRLHARSVFMRAATSSAQRLHFFMRAAALHARSALHAAPAALHAAPAALHAPRRARRPKGPVIPRPVRRLAVGIRPRPSPRRRRRMATSLRLHALPQMTFPGLLQPMAGPANGAAAEKACSLDLPPAARARFSRHDREWGSVPPRPCPASDRTFSFPIRY